MKHYLLQTLPKQWPLWYKLKLQHANPQSQKGVLSSDEHGNITIELLVPPEVRADAAFKCELKCKDKKVQARFNLLQHIFHYSSAGKEVSITILGPPKIQTMDTAGTAETHHLKYTRCLGHGGHGVDTSFK